MNDLTTAALACMIDHAILAPTATIREVEQACCLSVQHQVASVCVRPSDLPVAAAILSGSKTRISTVIGFPHGTTSTAGKKAEASQAIRDGAQELDMVLNIGRLRSGDRATVEEDIVTVCRLAHEQGVLIKIIFETCYLTDEQKVMACDICTRSGVDFVKTSTGFGTGGATVADVCLLREHTASGIGVKASGGIRDLDAMLAVIACGATRIGTSSTEKILSAARLREASGVLTVPAKDDVIGHQAGDTNDAGPVY